MYMEKAIFAAGCFWGVEDKFMKLDGVHATKVGYTGGQTPDPTYESVCSKSTGHAEAVQLEYDETKVSFEDLVRFFFQIHNPTTMNRQGLDIGDQYRSSIFYLNDSQKEIAEKVKKEVEESGVHNSSVVTVIENASEFFDAEDYHQQYIQKRNN